MNIMPCIAMAVIAVSTSVFARSAAPLPPASQPRQLLEVSKRRGQLEMADTTPYHLKASFQLFGDDGKPDETGTLDELWKDPSHYRLEISQPAGDLVEMRNDAQHWRIGNWPVLRIIPH